MVALRTISTLNVSVRGWRKTGRHVREGRRRKQAERIRRFVEGPAVDVAAAGGAAASGAAGVHGIDLKVCLWQESNSDSKLLNTYVEHDCKRHHSVEYLIAKSNHLLCKDLTSPSHRQVYFVDSDGKRQPLCPKTPLSSVPSYGGKVVLHVVVGPDAAVGGDARASDDDLYN